MNREIDYQKILDCIPVSSTNRDAWVRIGMALKHEGQPFEMFDSWSARDTRSKQYQGSEVTKRVWDSFRETGSGIVTGATITQIARDYGIDPFPASEVNGYMEWDDFITSDGEEPMKSDRPVERIKDPKKPVFQIVDYLETLFRDEDHINILTSAFTDEAGKKKPRGAGLMSITVGEYLKDLRRTADKEDFFDEVFGSYDHEAGVWVRINPITGQLSEDQKAVSDRNITRFDNALIECDELSVAEQLRIIKEIGLPYKALVYSGGRSVHAIVAVNAASLADYKERVSWLQQYCTANGLPVDTQNSNPSRMSRLPGAQRGEQRQILLETNRKPADFMEFRKMAQAAEDSKRMIIESFDSVCDSLPELAPELIEGILRKGHKLLISGPSKAGKSFALISLAIAIAEGKSWMGCKASMGKVLYLNLEIDHRSFVHRISDVYKALHCPVEHPQNLHVMHLRGQAEPLTELTPKLEAIIRRYQYDLVIIDPIYKVITGDENNASEMGKFCNLFDRLTVVNGGTCSVAYCHHHSKGSQAQKAAIDRASGSGVFARDPDAIIDLTEIGFTECDREELKARLMERAVDQKLRESGVWSNLEKVHPERLTDRIAKQEAVEDYFQAHGNQAEKEAFQQVVYEAERLGDCPAYRLSYTLREFASPPDKNVLFCYPIHVEDTTDFLKTLKLAGDNSPETMTKKHVEKAQKRHDQYREWYDQQRAAGKAVSTGDISRHFDVDRKTAYNWLKKQEDLISKNKKIWYLDEAEEADGDWGI